jgi:hypothetical protein
MLCAMALSWRHGLAFGGGILLGAAVGAAGFFAWKDPSGLRAAGAGPTAQQQLIAATGATPACHAEPLIPVSGERDGQFGANTDLTDKTLTDVAAYITVGNDASAHGRVRDAEVALVTACKIAAQLAGPGSVELAEAEYQLARHYLAVAAAGAPPDVRAPLLQRAEALYSQSTDLYAARHGAANEKTRLAAAGLALVKQAAALTVPMQLAAAPMAAASAAATPASASASAARAAASSTVAMGAGPAPKPKPKPKPKPVEPDHDIVRAAPEPTPAREMGAPPNPSFMEESTPGTPTPP